MKPVVKKDVADILLDLIAIPSVSAMSNRPVIDYAVRHLDPAQWSVDLYPYTDPAGTPKANLVALTKNAVNRRAELAFVCHTDTVPFQPDWREAVHPAVRDERIYGRGSCDVKGYLACVLAALSDADLTRTAAPLALVLTADEEVGCVGAKQLAAQRAFSTRYMAIGEPTGMRPIRAGKGYALATLTVRGREAHSAFPAEGRSAIYDAARVLFCLERIAEDLRDETNADFDPPYTTLNVGLIEGGTAKNIVPGECRLTVEWRPVPGDDPERVAASVRAMLARLAETTPGFDAVLDVKRADPPFRPSATENLAHRIAAMTGNSPGTISFGSEAAHLGALADETVVFGPGDMTVAHRSGEFVPVPALRECERVLRDLLSHAASEI